MSFFLKENFVLPNGVFQDGIDTDLASAGVIFQDGTYGYIKTFNNADAAIIVSKDSLTPREFSNRPIKITVSYKLVSLPTSDLMIVFALCNSASQPVIDAIYPRLACRLYNNNGTYQEHWYEVIGGTGYYWKQSTGTWVTPFAATSYTRVISLNAVYTISITIDPLTKTATFTNGSQTATSGIFDTGANPWWWVIGDNETANYYGQLTLDYIYVDNTSVRRHFTCLNSLTKGFRKSSIIRLINSLTTQFVGSFTLKNSILDHLPLRSHLTFLNAVGVKGRLIFLDGAWATRPVEGKQLDNAAAVEIDGIDRSDKLAEWSIDYYDQSISKQISVTVKDRAYADTIAIRKCSDDIYKSPRIEVTDHEGYSLGRFLIETKEESARRGEYVCTLKGRSMTTLLDKPFSPPLQTLYGEPTTKSAVVSDLASDEGIAVSWIVPDSILPAGALTCDDETPITVIQKVVCSGGGIVHTDREDNLVCDYKDYEAVGKTPILSFSSADITSISQSRTVPNGENQIEVSGYEDMSVTGGWATIQLSASKYYLRSNGYDTCIITARCWNEDNSVPDIELIEEEETEPDDNDHYEISVSKMIDTDGGGVVEIKRKDTGAAVAGPYEVLSDKRTIRTLTAMGDYTYQITYWGGESVSFSVDNFADISPTQVIVKGGIARTTLRAGAGGGGYAIVSGDYLDAQTAQITVQIADPRVGSIEVSADPSTINPNGMPNDESTVKVRILDSEGASAQNGLSVVLIIEQGNGSWSHVSTLRTTTLSTTTETITDGTVSDPIYSNSEIEVTTQYPITSLTSIYRVINGARYTAVNYASGATVVRSRVTLTTPLPRPGTPIIVTYTASGMAQTTFYPPSSVPYEGEKNWIVAYSGGETGTCDIMVDNPGGGGDGLGGGGGTRKKKPLRQTVEFDDYFKPTNDNNVRQSFGSRIIVLPAGYSSIEVGDQEDFIIRNLAGGVIDNAEVRKFESQDGYQIILTMRANVRSSGGSNGTSGDIKTQIKTVEGSRKVLDEDTQTPISGALVTLYWSEAGGENETVTTNDNGIFYFRRGVVGATVTLYITHPDYEDLIGTITIPGTLPSESVSSTDPTSPKETYDTCYFDIIVPFWFR